MTVTENSATRVSIEDHYEISDFLFQEADILDEWRFRDWLDLFTPDVKYWAPVRENRTWRERKLEMSGPGQSAYFDDDLNGLRQRVDRLYTHMAWAEEPPSRTRHLVSNIRAWEGATPGEFTVASSFHMYRTRSERDQDAVVGRRFDTLRSVEGDSPTTLRIAERKVVFDASTLLVKNLSAFY